MLFISLFTFCLLFSTVFSIGKEITLFTSTDYSNGAGNQGSSLPVPSNNRSENENYPATFSSLSGEETTLTPLSAQPNVSDIEPLLGSFERFLIASEKLLSLDITQILNITPYNPDEILQFTTLRDKTVALIEILRTKNSRFFPIGSQSDFSLVGSQSSIEFYGNVATEINNVLFHLQANQCPANPKKYSAEENSEYHNNECSYREMIYRRNVYSCLNNLKNFLNYYTNDFAKDINEIQRLDYLNAIDQLIILLKNGLFAKIPFRDDVHRNVSNGNESQVDIHQPTVPEKSDSHKRTGYESCDESQNAAKRTRYESCDESQNTAKRTRYESCDESQNAAKRTRYESCEEFKRLKKQIRSSILKLLNYFSETPCTVFHQIYDYKCPISKVIKRSFSICLIFPVGTKRYIAKHAGVAQNNANLYFYQATDSFTDVCFLSLFINIMRCLVQNFIEWTDSLFEYGNLILDSINSLRTEHRPFIQLFGFPLKTTSLRDTRKSFLFLSLFNYADKIKDCLDLSHLQEYIQDSLDSLMKLLNRRELPAGLENLNEKFNLSLAIKNFGSYHADFTILSFVYGQKKENGTGKMFFEELWTMFTCQIESNSGPEKDSKDSNAQQLSLASDSIIFVTNDNGSDLTTNLPKVFQYHLILTIDRILANSMDTVTELNEFFKDFDKLLVASRIGCLNQKYLDKYKLILKHLYEISTTHGNAKAFNYCIQSLWKVYNIQYKNFIYKVGKIVSSDGTNINYLQASENILKQSQPNDVFCKFIESFKIDSDHFQIFKLILFSEYESVIKIHRSLLQLLADTSKCKEIKTNLNELLKNTSITYKSSKLSILQTDSVASLKIFNMAYSLLHDSLSKESYGILFSMLITSFKKDYSLLGIPVGFDTDFFIPILLSKGKGNVHINNLNHTTPEEDKKDSKEFFSYLIDYLILNESF